MMRRNGLGYVARALLFNVMLIGAIALGSLQARASEPGPLKILALGDSLTAGYGLQTPDAFPAQLEAALAKLGVKAKVLQGGVSGDTTAGGRARLAWALAAKPQIAIVELGANDGLRGLDPTQTRANLDAIIRELKAAKVTVLLTGMYAPPNLGREYERHFNPIFPELAKAHDVAFYPFFLAGVAARPHLNQADGIHPNAAGVRVIVERIAPSVIRLIEPLARARADG